MTHPGMGTLCHTPWLNAECGDCTGAAGWVSLFLPLLLLPGFVLFSPGLL